MSADASGSRYVPAAGHRALTRVYDPVMAVTMRERDWRPKLRDAVSASVPQGGTFVDVGAGTGTLAIAFSAARPDAIVIAVDGDDEALGIARSKDGADRVEWTTGFAGELPFEDGAADAVAVSLLLHHLDTPAKLDALRDIHRILGPGGSIHVADWGKPRDPVIGAAFFALRLIDGFSNTSAHAEGLIPGLLVEAGFGEPVISDRLRTTWGSLELMSAGRG